MYLLYLDDSGSADNSNEDYFVLGGICLPETSVRWLSYEVEKIALEISPDDPGEIEFHAAEIFRGHEMPWKAFYDKRKRIEIIQKVLCTIQQAYSSTVTFACAVHKASLPGQDPVLVAFEDLSSRFNMYIQRKAAEDNPQKGLIIMDKTTYEEGLQNLAATIRKSGNRWGAQLRNICEVPLFIDSRACRLVQLADHIAYAVFRRYNSNDLTYFTCIENRFDQEGGIIHGLVHRQTINRNCTCPACLTRREKSDQPA